MAPHKKVRTLEQLTASALETYIKDICLEQIYHGSRTAADVTEAIETVKVLLKPIMPHHQNMISRISLHILSTLRNFFGPLAEGGLEAKQQLEVVLLAAFKLLRINLGEWQLEPLEVIVGEMHNMKDLAIFCSAICLDNVDIFIRKHFIKINSALRVKIINQILHGTKQWSNLVSFTFHNQCTNEIVSSLCQNCPSIKRIDLTNSVVTDACISPLNTCRYLEVIVLTHTYVSNAGLYSFLTESQSERLFSIQCWDIPCTRICDALIRMWEHEYSASLERFPSRTVEHLVCSSMSEKGLLLLSRYFPNLISLEIKAEYTMPIACLSSHRRLKELSLAFWYGSMDGLLIPSLCPLIVSLQVNLEMLSLDNFIDTIASSCPHLQSLRIEQYIPPQFNYTSIAPSRHFDPFQKLTKLSWLGIIQPAYAAYILKYAVNINTIHLHPSLDMPSASITDVFFQSILAVNPFSRLKKLQVFRSRAFSVSLDMLKQLIKDCHNLSIIDIFLKKEDRSYLEAFINERNYDVHLFKERYRIRVE